MIPAEIFLMMNSIVIGLLIVVLIISALIGGPLEGAMARVKA